MATVFFPGDFDPVHEGYLAIAGEILARGLADRVLFVLWEDAPGRSAAKLAHRRAMAALAVEGREGLGLWEVSLPRGASFRTLAERARGALAGEAAVLSHREGREGSSLALFRAEDDGAGPNPPRLDAEDLRRGEEAARAAAAAYDDAPGLLPACVARYIARYSLYRADPEEGLRALLSDRRLQHSRGTRDTALELAARFGAPLQKAAAAGLLHDCARELPLDRMRAMAERQGLTAGREMPGSAELLHAPAGAFLARARFGVEDGGILDAIRFHTTGRAGMSALELCVYVADAMEPGRVAYPGLEKIRALAREDLKKAALAALWSSRRHVLSQGGILAPGTREAIRDLATQTI